MTNSAGWPSLWIVVGALALAACGDEIVVVEEEYPLAVNADPLCVLDIRVDDDGRTYWKGEAVSDEEFDRRLKAGRISEACVRQGKSSPPPP